MMRRTLSTMKSSLALVLVVAATGIIQMAPRRVLAFGNNDIGRRDALAKAGQAFVGGLGILLADPEASIADERYIVKAREASQLPFDVYSITPDPSESLNPMLTSMNKQDLVRSLVERSTSKGGAIWLGEHHNSAKDHLLQADIIRDLYDGRKAVSGTSLPMAIGLEQIQVQFQPALDDYIAGTISDDKFKELVQWEKRWTWPFEAYLPVFETARELGIRMLALNVDSEDLARVERDGLPGLEQSRLQKYITDPYGFANFAKPPEFRAYVDYVIRPSYDLHKAMGLLKYSVSGQQLAEDMPFRNFFSGRILWDEAMASAAHDWTQNNPRGLLVGLVGADHVKFVNGISGRFTRLSAGTRDCTSVILNPTLIDTRPPGSVGSVENSASSLYPDRITLQLRYLKEGVDVTSDEVRASPDSTGGVLALADYIVVG